MCWRRTFGFKGEKLKGYWRKIHNEELLRMCYWSQVIRTIK